MNPQPLQACIFVGAQEQQQQQQRMQIPARIDGDEARLETDDYRCDEVLALNEDEEPAVQVDKHMHGGYSNGTVAPTRTSELTIAFEGEVYVFPAVTPQKVQAVLLLLGSRDTPSSLPSSEFLLQQNARVVDDASRGSKFSRRFASLVRFREKRKERCFEKKIRYSCRKEVAQRMHRKNGQFASVKDYQMGEGNGDSSDGNSRQELRTCQHCGINEKSTPAMRRGPGGPRTLCNACGLMWANKGTLRDLSKGGRSVPYDRVEPVTSNDIKPLTIEYSQQDEQGSSEDTKPAAFYPANPARSDGQSMLETTRSDTQGLPIQMDHSSVDLDGEDLQETLDEFANASGSEFEIPAHFNEQDCRVMHFNLQVDVDPDMGTSWPGT